MPGLSLSFPLTLPLPPGERIKVRELAMTAKRYPELSL